MNVKDSIRKRLDKSFAIIAAVCSAGLIACGVALFVISMQYHSALENYGFSQGDIGKAIALVNIFWTQNYKNYSVTA